MLRPLILINNKLRIEIARRGAEIQSIRSLNDDTEFIWSGDATYWARRAPLLFPIVGKIRDNTYAHKGARFSLPQHGFARDSDFELHTSDESSAHYIFSSNDTTRAQYPFDFDLYVHYKLLEDTLYVTYEIVHTFGEPLPYAIGTHPAFALGTGTDNASIVSTEQLPEQVARLIGGLMQNEKYDYQHGGNTMELKENTFCDDALIFKDFIPSSWKLLRRDGKSVEVTQRGFTHSALWSKPGAPFVCIEYWSGHADTSDAPEELTAKPTLTHLAAGQAHYTTAMRFNC